MRIWRICIFRIVVLARRWPYFAIGFVKELVALLLPIVASIGNGKRQIGAGRTTGPADAAAAVVEAIAAGDAWATVWLQVGGAATELADTVAAVVEAIAAAGARVAVV